MKHDSQPVPLICCNCGASRGDLRKRLPRGWKRKSEFTYCPSCWCSRYILRAISLPIAGPLDCDWKELTNILHQMWAETTQASNWLVRELYVRDVRRAEQARMPPMPSVYLYPEARENFPGLPARTLAALEQKIKRTYHALRYDVVWKCSASLPTYRYPMPFPVPNQCWTIQEQGASPVVSVQMGGRRIRLRMRSGARYQRQLQAISKIISGDAVRGELSLYKRADELMCQLVAWLPRPAAQEHGSDILEVRTSGNALIMALNTKDEQVWTYNGDQLRRWQAEHRVQLQRWAEDTKAEHRPIPPFAERRANAVRKYHNRTRTACHTIASLVVNYAVRRKFGGIRYDDSNQTYCEQFPWFELRLRIAEKCGVAGLTFEHGASGDKSGVEQNIPVKRATG